MPLYSHVHASYYDGAHLLLMLPALPPFLTPSPNCRISSRRRVTASSRTSSLPACLPGSSAGYCLASWRQMASCRLLCLLAHPGHNQPLMPTSTRIKAELPEPSSSSHYRHHVNGVDNFLVRFSRLIMHSADDEAYWCHVVMV